jgi:DNA-binding protein HU-beta
VQEPHTLWSVEEKRGRKTENAKAGVLGRKLPASPADWRSGPMPVKNGSRSANSPPPSAKSASGADFTVDIPSRGRKIQPSGFPTQRALRPGTALGTKKTCLGEKMNKADLVDKIAGACEISKAQANTAIDTAMDSVTAALRKGDRVALIGFGTFSVSQRKARNGRNPQTGATIKIAARKVAKFTPGAELKKAVNRK